MTAVKHTYSRPNSYNLFESVSAIEPLTKYFNILYLVFGRVGKPERVRGQAKFPPSKLLHISKKGILFVAVAHIQNVNIDASCISFVLNFFYITNQVLSVTV